MAAANPIDSPSETVSQRAREVFVAFLRLGCTSFGGPVAHLGYFREEFVARRKWLDDAAFSDVVALCQFLPGPASSEVGFTIGLFRAGALGALAAWTAFTLPSALLMLAVASGHALFASRIGAGVVHALEVIAVAVVAQAVWGMARTLAPDASRIAIAALAALVVLAWKVSLAQLAAILLGAVLGALVCRTIPLPSSHAIPQRVGKGIAVAALCTFAALLVVPPAYLAAHANPPVQLFQAFYRTGALVFGGGHVVLPLLHSAVVDAGWTDNATFLAGYGAAQAMPGPLFTFAAYLGTVARPAPTPIAGAAIALAAIFLPGFLLVVGVLPFWERLRTNRSTRAIFAGVNAAVVGILFAALCRPVWPNGIHNAGDLAGGVAAFVALHLLKAPPWLVVIAGGVLGAALAALR
jgi:chromate transporter